MQREPNVQGPGSLQKRTKDAAGKTVQGGMKRGTPEVWAAAAGGRRATSEPAGPVGVVLSEGLLLSSLHSDLQE